METPWGEIESLRELRLPPGRGSLGPEAWLALKRRRFLGALVAALAEKSYAEVTIPDLERLSGCGREEFYRVFRSKEDCMLQGVDALYRHALERTATAFVAEGGRWDRRMEAAFAELVDLMREQPAAARMSIVEVYAAGEDAARRVDVALRGFGRLLARAYREGGREDLPKGLIAAEVAGIEMFFHHRLHRGEEALLAGTAEQLLGWALSYDPPSSPLRRPRTRSTPPPPEQSEAQEEPIERILRAVADICAEEGVTNLTAQKIAPRAHVSLGTLYRHFRGADPAFLACFIAARDRALAAALAGFEREEDWPLAVRAGIESTFTYLASEPAFARVAMVEVLAAGPEALKARDPALAPFFAVIEPGLEFAPDAPPIAPELCVFAIYSLAGRHIARFGSAGLPALVPTATFIALAPFLGSGAATEVANATGT